MRFKLILFLMLLFFCGSAFAQETKVEKDSNEKVHLIIFSELFSENSKIVEFRNFKGEISEGCKTEPNTKEAKICDALKQFAEENNMKFIADKDRFMRWMDERSLYVNTGGLPDITDITKDFIKFYNTRFAKKND